MPYANPEDKNRWRRANPTSGVEARKLWKLKNKRLLRRRMVESKYKLSSEEHSALLASQAFMCAFPFCGKEVSISSPIDHDHETGRVRGILCNAHNVALGAFERLIPHATFVLEYLGRFK